MTSFLFLFKITKSIHLLLSYGVFVKRIPQTLSSTKHHRLMLRLMIVFTLLSEDTTYITEYGKVELVFK